MTRTLKFPIRPLLALLIGGIAGITPCFAQEPAALKPSATPEQAGKDEKKEHASLEVLLKDVIKYLNENNTTDANLKLLEAERIAPDHFMIYNLRGAIHTKQRNFGKARESFAKARELNPKAFEPIFNEAEMFFVEGDFAEAGKLFQKLSDDYPKLKMDMRHLVLFKVLLCELKQGHKEAVDKILSNFSYIDDSPAYYFSHYALEMVAGRDDKAREWYERIKKIFRPKEMANYADALMELGMMPSIQVPQTKGGRVFPPEAK